MKFFGTFIGAKLDLQDYQAILQEHLVKELHKVANAWLKAVAGSGGRVPLWSGMSRASLLELSELIDGRVVLTPLKTKSRIPQGRALGMAVQDIKPTEVSITIVTDVPHYNIQEYRRVAKGGSPRAPWHSLEAGAMAYQSVAQAATLPPPIFKPVKIKAI